MAPSDRNLRPALASPGSVALHALGRQYQMPADPGLHRRVPGVGNDHVFGLGPGAGEFVGAADRAYHVVAPLHDDPRQMTDPLDPSDQVTLADKQMAAEKMCFDPRQPQSQPFLAK